MNQKKIDQVIDSLDCKELLSDIVSSILEKKPLVGADGALTTLMKKTLEAMLVGEAENHLLREGEENNRKNGKNSKTLRTNLGSFELLTPRDRNASFEPQVVKKRQTSLHPELRTFI